MFCNACGKTIAEDARFCTYCGVGVGGPMPMKKLERSRSDRKVAGVCGGVGNYLGLDVTLIRVLWAFVTLLSGIIPGVIAYLLAWIIVPEEVETRAVVAAGQPVATQ